MFKSEIAVHHHGLAIFLCKDERVGVAKNPTESGVGSCNWAVFCYDLSPVLSIQLGSWEFDLL